MPRKRDVPDIPFTNNSEGNFDKNYVLGEELGTGAFSVVQEATHKHTGVSYAAKIVTIDSLSKSDEEDLMYEIELLHKLSKNPYIIGLNDVFREDGNYYLMTEICTGGELLDRIIDKEQYTEEEARDCCICMFDAILYCHKRHIVHRDLKPENILLQSHDNDTQVKLADFGLAKKVLKPKSLTTICGSPGYVAPEVLQGKPYDLRVDMWSLGVIIYILIGGYPPFDEEDQEELFENICGGRYEFHDDTWGEISYGAKKLVGGLMTVKRKKRLTAEEAMEHYWIKNDADMREFDAKRMSRAAVHAVVAADKFRLSGEAFASPEEEEESEEEEEPELEPEPTPVSMPMTMPAPVEEEDETERPEEEPPVAVVAEPPPPPKKVEPAPAPAPAPKPAPAPAPKRAPPPPPPKPVAAPAPAPPPPPPKPAPAPAPAPPPKPAPAKAPAPPPKPAPVEEAPAPAPAPPPRRRRGGARAQNADRGVTTVMWPPMDPSKMNANKRKERVRTSILDYTGPFYSAEELRNQSVAGLDYRVREKYLSPEEFKKLFRCTKEEFEALPRWKQTQRKWKLKLLVGDAALVAMPRNAGAADATASGRAVSDDGGQGITIQWSSNKKVKKPPPLRGTGSPRSPSGRKQYVAGYDPKSSPTRIAGGKLSSISSKFEKSAPITEPAKPEAPKQPRVRKARVSRPTGSAPAPAPAKPAAPAADDGPFYLPDQLRKEAVPGLDYQNREKYLTPSTFKELFGCTKEEFKAMPKYKQTSLKRKAKMLVKETSSSSSSSTPYSRTTSMPAVNQDKAETVSPRRRSLYSVKTPDGKTLKVDVKPDESIEDVKKKIGAASGIAPEKQNLIFEGKDSGNNPAIEEAKKKSAAQAAAPASPKRKKTTYSVKTPDGKTIKVEVGPDENMDDVKKKIAKMAGIPESQQQLFFEGKDGKDGKSVSPTGGKPKVAAAAAKPASPKRKKKIYSVKTPDGRTIKVECGPDESMEDVKRKIGEAAGIPPEQQQLFFEGKEMGGSSKPLPKNVPL